MLIRARLVSATPNGAKKSSTPPAKSASPQTPTQRSSSFDDRALRALIAVSFSLDDDYWHAPYHFNSTTLSLL